MTLKEAILIALKRLNKPAQNAEVLDFIQRENLYDFGAGKTPGSSVGAVLGGFIRKGDTRVKRTRQGKNFVYYLSAEEAKYKLKAQESEIKNVEDKKENLVFNERSLHTLLSTYLKETKISSKTIFHEQSKNSRDSNQKWVHPDMVGLSFLNLEKKASQALLKAVNRADILRLSAYEIKKEINTDSELKKYFFQAVSNSSWANFGYLVAFDIADGLKDELERLSQSFGIGFIELKANPFESRELFPATYRELDFRTIDKLCNINPAFLNFIEHAEKLITAEEKYFGAAKNDFNRFCDPILANDSEIESYCLKHHIPYGEDDEEEIIEVEESTPTQEVDEVNFFEAGSSTGKKIAYLRFRGERIEAKTYADLYQKLFKILFANFREAILAKADKIQLSRDTSKLRGAREISDGYFIHTGMSSEAKTRRIKQTLTYLDLEDELFIKYAD